MILSAAVGIWLLSFMLFHLNPLNDKTDPGSKMSYGHPDNIANILKLKEQLAQEGEGNTLILQWIVIWPYLCPTVMTVGCLLIELAWSSCVVGVGRVLKL